MKRIYVLFTALCVCCVLAAQDIKELLILHTNDTHSRVEPISITDPSCYLNQRNAETEQGFVIVRLW